MLAPVAQLTSWKHHCCSDCGNELGLIERCQRCGLLIHTDFCHAKKNHTASCRDGEPLNLDDDLIPAKLASEGLSINWEKVATAAEMVLPRDPVSINTNIVVVTVNNDTYAASPLMGMEHFSTTLPKSVVGEAFSNRVDAIDNVYGMQSGRVIVVVRPKEGEDTRYMGVSVYHHR